MLRGLTPNNTTSQFITFTKKIISIQDFLSWFILQNIRHSVHMIDLHYDNILLFNH